MSDIDVGDYIHHGPSGECWVVGLVEGDRLYWIGWPFGGSAKLSDCTLIEKATEESRERLLRDLAAHTSSERPVTAAKERIARERQT